MYKTEKRKKTRKPFYGTIIIQWHKLLRTFAAEHKLALVELLIWRHSLLPDEQTDTLMISIDSTNTYTVNNFFLEFNNYIPCNK